MPKQRYARSKRRLPTSRLVALILLQRSLSQHVQDPTAGTPVIVGLVIGIGIFILYWHTQEFSRPTNGEGCASRLQVSRGQGLNDHEQN